MSYDLLQLCFWEFGSAGTEIVIRIVTKIVTKIDLPGYIKSDISSTSGLVLEGWCWDEIFPSLWEGLESTEFLPEDISIKKV